MKQIKVSVPATSANVGSGFDAVGLAVTLYNTATFEESDKLDISAADGTRIPRGESNLIYRSAKSLFDRVGKRMPPLRIVQTNPIPMARGLGSSSACIIAGLLGANRMLGDVLDTQELLTLATAIEGHPDNVAPALLGGLTTSVFEGGQVYSVKREVDPSLCFAAVVPDYKLLTEAARAALPGQIPHRDAVYNLSRAALLPAAFCDGRHDLLPIATEDKLHQPYRIPLWNRGWKPWRAWTDVKHSHCCAWMQTTPAQRSNDRGTEKFCTFGLWIEDGMPLETPRRPQRAGRACPGRRAAGTLRQRKGPVFRLVSDAP